ncbi:MAG TPA: hypothetical protein VNT99_10040 [Methylomirabilota bacterium]|nr:hypothetical protein [Methylomirabilota bacterium]
MRSAVAGMVLSAGAASAADAMIITSATKQFVVRGLPQRSLLAASANSETVYLDPALLAVTCETVKRALQRELGWGERWSGAVYINIHPIRFDNEPIRINTSRADGRWRYHVEMPDEVHRRELITTLIEVLLAEFADRSGAQESVELPPWLTEGLAAHLLQGPLAGAAFQARTLNEIRDQPALRAARTTRHADVDKLLRETAQQYGALTFDQLNWIEFDEKDQRAAAGYRHSAHLFVRELLRLRGGPDCICATLAFLPDHLNWQTAFLRGFEPHFRRLLDVEKWWSLSVAQIKTHDNSLTWSQPEAWKKMDEILYTPMQVRLRGEGVPHVTPVALQTVIKDWQFEEQVALLRTKIVQLQTAHLRWPAPLASLADSYRVTMDKYLQARSGAWFDARGRAAASRAVAELDALDLQRLNLAGQGVATRASGPAPLTPP